MRHKGYLAGSCGGFSEQENSCQSLPFSNLLFFLAYIIITASIIPHLSKPRYPAIFHSCPIRKIETTQLLGTSPLPETFLIGKQKGKLHRNLCLDNFGVANSKFQYKLFENYWFLVRQACAEM